MDRRELDKILDAGDIDIFDVDTQDETRQPIQDGWWVHPHHGRTNFDKVGLVVSAGGLASRVWFGVKDNRGELYIPTVINDNLVRASEIGVHTTHFLNGPCSMRDSIVRMIGGLQGVFYDWRNDGRHARVWFGEMWDRYIAKLVVVDTY